MNRLKNPERCTEQDVSTSTAKKKRQPRRIQSSVNTQMTPASTKTLDRGPSVSPNYNNSHTTTEIYPTHLAAAVPVTLLPVNHSNDVMNDAIKLHSSGDNRCAYMNYSYVSGVDMNTPGFCDLKPCVSHLWNQTSYNFHC